MNYIFLQITLILHIPNMPYKNPEKQKEWYRKNRERVLERVSKNYKNNVEEKKEYARKYHQKNREKNLLQQKEYRKNNKEKYRLAIDLWMKENREEYKIWKKQWQKEYATKNRDKLNAGYAKRRAQKKNSIDETTDFEKIKKFYLLAEHLSNELGEKYCVDHIRPLCAGGKHHQDNLQVITMVDNLKKGKKFPFGVSTSYNPEMYFNPDWTWTTHT